MHLHNVYAEGELDEVATCKDSLQIQMEGARQVKRQRKTYNLDADISVGYRVNSSPATQFRIWATQTLKQHLVAGYTLNKHGLQERGIEFEQALALRSQTLSNQQLINEQGQTVIGVIHDYARSWSLLRGYDEQSLGEQVAKQACRQSLALPEALDAIVQLNATARRTARMDLLL